MENKNAPTVKPNKGVRFYNPGDRFSEPLNYSIEGYGDIHAIARWTVDAPEASFFQVPTELRILADGQRLPVDFPTTVNIKFKDRGVIMIDEEWLPGEDEDEADRLPFARNEKEAIEKGKRLWIRYLQTIVRNHVEACQRARAMGGFPGEASGFTRRAFKLLNMTDPATKEFESLQNDRPKQAENEDTKSLRAQVEELQKTVLRLMHNQQAKERQDEADKVEAATAAKTRGK